MLPTLLLEICRMMFNAFDLYWENAKAEIKLFAGRIMSTFCNTRIYQASAQQNFFNRYSDICTWLVVELLKQFKVKHIEKTDRHHKIMWTYTVQKTLLETASQECSTIYTDVCELWFGHSLLVPVFGAMLNDDCKVGITHRSKPCLVHLVATMAWYDKRKHLL